MAKAAGPFHVVYGEEEFLMDRFVAHRRTTWKDRQIILRDGGSTTEGELVTLCESRSLFDEDAGRAVILDNAQDMKTEKILSAYIEAKNPKDQYTILLAIIRDKKLSSVWSAAVKKGIQYVFPKFKPWETEKVLDRITEEAKDLGLQLDKGVPELIHRFLGDNLRSTMNELQKLTYLVGPGGMVKKEHVGLVLAPNVPVEPYQIAEATVSKNVKHALGLLSLIYKNQGDSVLVPVTSSLQKQVEKILVTREMLDKGDGPDVIALRFGIHEFVCKKNLIPLAQKHTVKSLLGHMNRLCKLEAQVKGAARSKRTLVELAVLSVAS